MLSLRFKKSLLKVGVRMPMLGSKSRISVRWGNTFCLIDSTVVLEDGVVIFQLKFRRHLHVILLANVRSLALKASLLNLCISHGLIVWNVLYVTKVDVKNASVAIVLSLASLKVHSLKQLSVRLLWLESLIVLEYSLRLSVSKDKSLMLLVRFLVHVLRKVFHAQLTCLPSKQFWIISIIRFADMRSILSSRLRYSWCLHSFRS